jgi:5-enolpyruvylshikimate-3-phosphate synthase
MQGDKAIMDVLNLYTAAFLQEAGGRRREAGGGRQEAGIDASGIPDLVPVISVAAAVTPGETRIYNAARLRLKESDRLNKGEKRDGISCSFSLGNTGSRKWSEKSSGGGRKSPK